MPNKYDFNEALMELRSGHIDSALMAMATSKAKGIEASRDAIYLELRAREISRLRMFGRLKAGMLLKGDVAPGSGPVRRVGFLVWFFGGLCAYFLLALLVATVVSLAGWNS